jgi:hypothetical protein
MTQPRFVSTPPDPFIGTWELDPASLDYQAGRPGKRATYEIEASPNGLRFTLDADGKPMRVRSGGPLDGTPQLLPAGDSTPKLVLKRHAPVKALLLRGDQVIDRWTREVSADGRPMTII